MKVITMGHGRRSKESNPWHGVRTPWCVADVGPRLMSLLNYFLCTAISEYGYSEVMDNRFFTVREDN